MNKTEAVILCRYVKALCPAQQFDEFTPDAWADVMWDIDAADAKTAVQEIIRGGEKFVDPGAIIGKVKRIRQKRCLAFPCNPIPPRGLTDAEEVEWTRRAWEAIGSGRAKTPADIGMDPEPQAVDHKRMRELTGRAFRDASADDDPQASA